MHRCCPAALSILCCILAHTSIYFSIHAIDTHKSNQQSLIVTKNLTYPREALNECMNPAFILFNLPKSEEQGAPSHSVTHVPVQSQDRMVVSAVSLSLQ